jgi:DNA-binding transcriptional regulator YdaS (Cro superfamily)
MKQPTVLKEAIRAAGGGAAVARQLGLKSRQAIYQWTRVPAEHCATVERMSGIPRHILRPDLWSKPERIP